METKPTISNLILAYHLNLAAQKVGIKFYSSTLIFDILEIFPNLNQEDFITAIDNGANGKYGKSDGISTNEVCVWIREYIKETSK